MKQLLCVAGAIAGSAAAAMVMFGCGPSPDFYDEVVEPNEIQTQTHDRTPDRPHDAAANVSTSALFGKWTGVGHQNNGTQWAMEVDVTRADQGPCAVVRYPDLGCAGFWTCTCSDEGGHIQAVERITDGQDKCADRVDIDLHMGADGKLVFNASTGDIRADGRLDRAE
jgi:hypothetical protein